MKFASARSRRYRRNFENFLHRQWELVETLQKLEKLFFLKIFSRLKNWVKIAFFALWVKIFHHFLIDAAEIFSFWVEIGAYSTRKWRKNRKIRRYSRERAEAKLAIFLSACSRFYRRIFRFFLHFRVEYALSSPSKLKNFSITSIKNSKILKQNFEEVLVPVLIFIDL